MSDNPYQSPNATFSAAMPTTLQRPTSVTVFGILNLVFGVFGLCGLAISAPMYFGSINEEMRKQNPFLQLFHENQFFRVFTSLQMAFGFCLVVILIVAGICLLQSKPLGRSLSVFYGWSAIVAHVLGTVISVVFVLGPMMAKLDSMPPGREKGAMIGGLIGGIFGSCIGVIYPLALLFFMTRQNVVAYFRAASSTTN